MKQHTDGNCGGRGGARAALRRVGLLAPALPFLAAALAGCVPVGSVVGRPAAVMAEGEQRGSFGLGGVLFERSSFDEEDFSLPAFYPYLSYAVGVGNGFDFEVAGWLIGAEDAGGAGHLNLILRNQILGEPYVMEAEGQVRTRPLDLSVEAGAAASFGVTDTDAIGWADVHLGANASVPLPWGATPYFSYRFHWGATPAGPIQIQMLFAGIEFTREGWGRVCVEMFHGYPASYELQNLWRTWGCNLLYRTEDF